MGNRKLINILIALTIRPSVLAGKNFPKILSVQPNSLKFFRFKIQIYTFELGNMKFSKVGQNRPKWFQRKFYERIARGLTIRIIQSVL